jgi:hypothetical protein
MAQIYVDAKRRTVTSMARPYRPDPEPATVPVTTVLRIGMVGWGVMLLATVLVQTLHEGDRFYWPWVCVVGITLGVLGEAYVRRGRGNATAADAASQVPLRRSKAR